MSEDTPGHARLDGGGVGDGGRGDPLGRDREELLGQLLDSARQLWRRCGGLLRRGWHEAHVDAAVELSLRHAHAEALVAAHLVEALVHHCVLVPDQ